MNPFKYSDEKISDTEFMIAIPSVIIGVGILSLPREVAIVTLFSDGWISILVAGIMVTFITILATKVAALFPGKSFLSYTTYLVTKPIALLFLFIIITVSLFFSAYSTRYIAYIAQQYLFEHTPMEVIALSFILVVVYAVSGSRAGLFRLNLLFLPIILFVFLFVGIFNVTWIERNNFLPLFQTDLKGYLLGIKETFTAFLGFEIVLIYTMLIKRPKNLTKKVIIGMSIPILFYIMIFLMTIGIFGYQVTANLEFPTIELAKRVDIPGGILERIDPFVFSIWTMTIFTTAAMLLDVVVFLLSSIFTKMNKRILTFILSPIVYYISMLPNQIDQVKYVTNFISVTATYLLTAMVIILFMMTKIRGVKNSESN